MEANHARNKSDLFSWFLPDYPEILINFPEFSLTFFRKPKIPDFSMIWQIPCFKWQTLYHLNYVLLTLDMVVTQLLCVLAFDSGDYLFSGVIKFMLVMYCLTAHCLRSPCKILDVKSYDTWTIFFWIIHTPSLWLWEGFLCMLCLYTIALVFVWLVQSMKLDIIHYFLCGLDVMGHALSTSFTVNTALC